MVRGSGRPARGVGVVWRLAAALALLAALLGGVSLAPAPADAAGAVLYEQWGVTGLLTYSYAAVTLADDFVVPPGGWTLGGVDLLGLQDGAPFTIMVFQNGPNNLPGALVASYPALTGPATVVQDLYRAYTLALPTPLALPAGTYWLAVEGDYGWAWMSSPGDQGQATAFRDAGCPAWCGLSGGRSFRLRAPEPPALSQVRGILTYGDTTGGVTARLTTTGGAPLPGATVAFTVNGTPVGTAPTNAQGVASLGGVTFPAGLNAGTQQSVQVCASFAGDDLYPATGPTCGPLVVGRRVLTVKPTDRTVGLKQPNPPTTPPAGCAPTGCWLELVSGSAFVNGDTWAALNFTNLRFQYSRNPASTNRTEQVGSAYRITALGATSTNYELRFQPGTLTVK